MAALCSVRVYRVWGCTVEQEYRISYLEVSYSILRILILSTNICCFPITFVSQGQLEISPSGEMNIPIVYGLGIGLSWLIFPFSQSSWILVVWMFS